VSNPSKQRGTAWETAVVRYLQEHGFPFAERRALSGVHDKGDVAGVAGWVLEAKNRKSLDLAGAVDEARKEAGNARTRWFAAVIKRTGKGDAGEGYVVMPLSVFCDYISED
jgi:predicted lipoprotein